MGIKNQLLRNVLLCIFATTLLQSKGYTQKAKQEVGLAIYNTGFGGLTAGFGAVINKKKDEKFLPTFWRGFKYGCLGGLINYGGKRIAHPLHLSKDSLTNQANAWPLLWGWPSKLVHSAGSSIIENAARNKRNVFDEYRIPVGFVNVSLTVTNNVKVKGKLMPFAFTSFLTNMVKSGSSLQFKESLLLGTPYFLSYNDDPSLGGHSAVSASNCIVLKKYASESSRSGFLISHEHIHVLQEREYYVFNQWLVKPYVELVNHEKPLAKFLNHYIYPDLPYMQTVYQFVVHPSESYYKNFFEMEAEHFATNSYIKR